MSLVRNIFQTLCFTDDATSDTRDDNQERDDIEIPEDRILAQSVIFVGALSAHTAVSAERKTDMSCRRPESQLSSPGVLSRLQTTGEYAHSP